MGEKCARIPEGDTCFPRLCLWCRPRKLLAAFADMRPAEEDRQWPCYFMTFTALKPQWWVPGAVSGSSNNSSIAGVIREEELGGPAGCFFPANIEVHFGRGVERASLEEPRALMVWNKLETRQDSIFSGFYIQGHHGTWWVQLLIWFHSS